MTRRALLILLALSACTAQVAEAASEPTLSGQRVELDGTADVSATLAGIASNRSQGRADLLKVNVLDGKLELDDQRYEAFGGTVGVTPVNQTTTTRNLQKVTGAGFAIQSQHRLVLLPLGNSAMRGQVQGGVWQTAPPGVLDFPPWASTVRAHPTIDRTGNLQQTVSTAVLTIEAPFVLVVWGANFTLEPGQTITTGLSKEPVAPGLERHIQREAFLTVKAGNITFPMDEKVLAYVSQAGISIADGRTTIERPAGVLPVDGSAIPANARELSFTGPLDMVLDAWGQGVALAFEVTPEEATIDGAVIRKAGGMPLWPFTVGILALVAVPAAAVAFRNQQYRRRIRSLDASMRSRRLEEGLATAQAIRRHHPTDPDALVAESMALLSAKRYDEAIHVLKAKGWTVALDPVREFLMAVAESGRGKREAALTWLASCLAKAPDLALEASAAPLLSKLVHEAQKRARQSSAGAGARPGHP